MLGGNRRVIGNLELLFPMPGHQGQERAPRRPSSTRATSGAPNQKISLSDLRASTGVAVSWDSPVGPLKFSFAAPIKKHEGDKLERFQFQLGRIF